jgi:hypothetical protein
MAGKIRRNGVISGLLRFVILGAGGLPVFWRGCRQRQNTVLDSLTLINQYRRLVVGQKLFALMIPHDDDNIGLLIRHHFRLTPDNCMAGSDPGAGDIGQKLAGNLRVRLCAERLIGQRITVEIEMRLIGHIPLGVFQKVVDRTAEYRPVRRCNSKNDLRLSCSFLGLATVNVVAGQRIIDEICRLRPVIGAMRVGFDDKRCPGIELFVLFVPPGKF